MHNSSPLPNLWVTLVLSESVLIVFACRAFSEEVEIARTRRVKFVARISSRVLGIWRALRM